mgnify:CR=1 FL=1
MKTIVSTGPCGASCPISALLPALAAQEAESVSIPESSGISESMAQDESGVSSSGSTADESTEPESGSNAEDGSILSRSPNPTVCRWSLTAALLRGRRLKPAAHCLLPTV